MRPQKVEIAEAKSVEVITSDEGVFSVLIDGEFILRIDKADTITAENAEGTVHLWGEEPEHQGIDAVKPNEPKQDGFVPVWDLNTAFNKLSELQRERTKYGFSSDIQRQMEEQMLTLVRSIAYDVKRIATR